ncbi:formate-dependent phosphoribosylglycinamide formyltransferase [Temperatibacter marinus]|uniref:Formate-dependent phosphoribosylglycinamide formyltransferase n=1 Tax=Temperatibacter marinus TaxID=1456591 RepID=A0AA52HB66_9PROT|nr:formate-dependent phosphoribosylglycinamide formyltransferase [Temperatibacter marinus]WND03323.1 formate-dependent phosphoribosylglycinamide formyltransferase [Temperatibacter marinus]
MKLGTPLTASATKVMLLGAGELGKEVIIALQRYGVEVTAVDRYENAPGHQVAHKAITIDMSNPVELLRVIKEEQPHYIVPEIEAIATEVLAEIEDQALATVIPTAKAVRLTMNREGIRTLAAEDLSLPTSAYAFASSAAEIRAAIEDGIGFPCFVKPVMSSSGKGQSLLKTEEDIDLAWRYSQEGGRVADGRVIVEGMVNFDYEITLLTVRSKSLDGSIQTSYCAPIGHKQKDGDYIESWQPQPMSELALKNAQKIACDITEALGGQGLFGVELFVKGDDVWFSEVSPRPHDTGLVTLVSQSQNEFELHARALLGLPTDTKMLSPAASAVIYGGMDAKGISFEGLDRALNIPQTEVRLFGKPESFEKRRMGVAVSTAEQVDMARARALDAAEKVKPCT